MATTVERTAVERFGGGGGMALLPWTKHMLTVLWEQLRLLVQVIYYSFISVFQMFRFEVHVRITDETGEHIQHMGTASNTPESFLFSSLFDGENGVMVGGSSPLSNFCADVGDPFAGKSTAEALLSSLRADDLCCGLVDDFVSRTAGKDEGILLGHQSTWKMGFPGDWNIFVSSADSCASSDACHRSCDNVLKPKEKVCKQETSEEDRSSQWSSEEEQNVVEFESEESRALWESFSKSSDPYNPFFFSACISTNSDMGKSKCDIKTSSDSDLKASEEMLGPPPLNMWVCRSDSESSWAGSECSSPDIDKEESDKLWELFSSPHDPYNPMFFTASTTSNPTLKTKPTSVCKQASLPAPPPKRGLETEETHSSSPPSEDDEEELLWKSLGQKDDPYHPLNFQASLQSSSASLKPCEHTQNPPAKTTKQRKASRANKPALPDRKLKQHSHPDKRLVPWKRPEQTPPLPPEEEENKAGSRQKKVRFSPLVQVHVMRTWPFARQASRKGHWEELARDRDRFRRRILDTEKAIGYCFSQPHREQIRASLDSALNHTDPEH